MILSRDSVLITAEYLAARLREGAPITILAVRSDDSVAPRPFATAPRLPGAIDTVLATDFAAPSDPVQGTRPLPAIADLQRAARSWGIRQHSAVVVYDHDGALQAARAWWVLRWAGIANTTILDGGFAAWQNAGLPTVDVVPPAPSVGDIVLSPGHMPVLTADTAAIRARRAVLLDTRIAPNYRGGPTATGAAPRGHIPGSRNLPAPNILTEDGRFAPNADLCGRYAAAGASPGREVGVYCGAGVSAAHAVAALACIGIEAAMYPGSWSAWVSDPTRPVATGAEPG